MRRALLLVVALGAPLAHAQEFRLHLGGGAGFPFLVNVTSLATFFTDGKARFDSDVTWEPSASLQSYSVGSAWHPLDRAFFVGGRLRLLQYQALWARGPNDVFVGFGLETGLRVRVGEGGRGVLHAALQVSFMPGQDVNLNTLVGLTAGFSWSVFER